MNTTRRPLVESLNFHSDDSTSKWCMLIGQWCQKEFSRFGTAVITKYNDYPIKKYVCVCVCVCVCVGDGGGRDLKRMNSSGIYLSHSHSLEAAFYNSVKDL